MQKNKSLFLFNLELLFMVYLFQMTIKMLIEEDIMNNTYQEVIIEHRIIFNCDTL